MYEYHVFDAPELLTGDSKMLEMWLNGNSILGWELVSICGNRLVLRRLTSLARNDEQRISNVKTSDGL
jgi:hypothetical protein